MSSSVSLNEGITGTRAATLALRSQTLRFASTIRLRPHMLKGSVIHGLDVVEPQVHPRIIACTTSGGAMPDVSTQVRVDSLALLERGQQEVRLRQGLAAAEGHRPRLVVNGGRACSSMTSATLIQRPTSVTCHRGHTSTRATRVAHVELSPAGPGCRRPGHPRRPHPVRARSHARPSRAYSHARSACYTAGARA